MQYCECGSLMIGDTCSNRRCESRDEALSSWLIGGTLWRFKKALTRDEAVKAVEGKDDVVYKFKPPKDRFIKPY